MIYAYAFAYAYAYIYIYIYTKITLRELLIDAYHGRPRVSN